jgi:cell division septum initiation protein DivIVA
MKNREMLARLEKLENKLFQLEQYINHNLFTARCEIGRLANSLRGCEFTRVDGKSDSERQQLLSE